MVKRRGRRSRHVGIRETSANEPLLTYRNTTQTTSKPELVTCSGNNVAETYLLATWRPVYRRRDSSPGFRMELENLVGDATGKGASGRTTRPKVPKHRPGAHCSVVVGKRGNARGAKGAGHPRRDRWVNGKPEEPTGFGGRRQPSLGGTSRMSREVHVRICERLGVQFPGPTRRLKGGPLEHVRYG